MINKRKKLLMEGKTEEEIDEILAPKKKHRKKEKKIKSNETNEGDDKTKLPTINDNI